jgi:hypothetical protein
MFMFVFNSPGVKAGGIFSKKIGLKQFNTGCRNPYESHDLC